MDLTSATARNRDRLLIRLHEDESGSMMATMLIVIALLLLMVLLIAHRTGGSVSKARESDRADRISLLIGLERAEAMNELVTLNHQAGDRLAWAVVASAVGGRHANREDLPRQIIDECQSLDRTISRRAAELRELGGETPAADPVSTPLAIGATIAEAKRSLKRALAREYQRRLEQGEFPPGADEREILNEWRELDRIESALKRSVRAIEHLIGSSVPTFLRQAAAIVDEAPARLDSLRRTLERETGLIIEIDPESVSLPVEPDPTAARAPGSNFSEPAGQLVRSAWPWVLYHRGPILDRLDRLPRSGASEAFLRWCQLMTLQLASEIDARGAPRMLVLQGSGPGLGGTESWRNSPEEAARLFCSLVFVLDRSHMDQSEGRTRTAHPSGTLRHSQVMIYPRGLVPGELSRWDTLSWSNTAPIFPDGPRTIPSPEHRQPWGIRLSPVTRFNEVAVMLPAPIGPIARPLVPAPRSVQSH